MKFKSAILAGALALVAAFAHAAPPVPNEARAYGDTLDFSGFAPQLSPGQSYIGGFTAPTSDDPWTSTSQTSNAGDSNCPRPASVKPDTCSIHRTVAKATRANKRYDASERYVDNGTWDVEGPVGGKFPLAGR